MHAQPGPRSTGTTNGAARRPCDAELHVLVVARDAGPRYSIANLLLDAGLRVTLASAFGVVEVVMQASEAFDAMVVAQSAEEITQFGIPQLVRSIDADLPIVVMDHDTTNSSAMVDMVQDALARWPLRERDGLLVH